MVDKQYYVEVVQDGQTVQKANVGNVKGLAGVRSHICSVCRRTFKENNMTQWRGKWYGVPCSCYKDISSLLFQEREQRARIIHDRLDRENR